MSTSTSEFAKTSMMPIGIQTLLTAVVLPFDLYLRTNSDQRYSLYRHQDHPITRDDMEGLLARGVHTLFIAENSADKYRDHLRDNVLNQPDLSPKDRYFVLREATRTILKDALSQRDAGVALNSTAEIGAELVQSICDGQVLLRDLLTVMAHDYSIFNQAMNVTTFCLLMARQLGITDQQVLLQIGQGALLHDIGTQQVPRNILDKPGELTDREAQIIKLHATWGFRMLCRRKDVAWSSLMMVLEHHERWDGRGYPCGLTGPEIHEFARLCAVADAYDALQCDRRGPSATRRADAVEYLQRQAGRAFDKEMVQCMIELISNQI